LLTVLAIVEWLGQSDPAGATGTTIEMMPSRYNSGGNVTDYGVHYDDNPGGAAYDYSGSSGTDAWLRGEAVQNLSNTTRYMYWNESSCRVRGRLEKYVSGSWTDYYDWDVDILHLSNMPTSTQYTQTISTSGDWFDEIVGKDAACGTSQYHSHLEMTPSSVLSIAFKLANTCWSNGSDCNIGNVKQDDGTTTCPPGAPNNNSVATSGNITRYICETWSAKSYSDQAASFLLAT